MNRITDRVSWSDPLIRRFKKGRTSVQPVDDFSAGNCRERTRLVAIVRWLLLLVLALYGALAGSTYLFSRYGFFITKEQILLLVLTLLSVLIYNLTFHFYQGAQTCHNLARLQIILDLVAVTVLIHCSGGATSWFWPVYMIVTLEAAYLMENQRDVWQIGAAGGLLYCTLLFLENGEVIPSVRMPFVDPALNHDTHYLFLMAVWV
ncbi:MAG TPA: GGDEF domain-containing protein, partial [Geobacteraceae bacterium]|nr:GGDEF domain-containing protein [Geobacteraceae bacterium]